MRERAVATLLAALLAGCAPARVYTRPIDDDAIRAATTFAFLPTDWAPAGYRRTPLTNDVLTIVEDETSRVLHARGFTVGPPESADLIVLVGAGARPRTTIAAARQDALGNQVGVRDPDAPFDYAEGSLAIDVFGGHSGHRLWHGAALALIHAGPVDRERVSRAVERVLGTFPVRAAVMSGLPR